MMRLRRRHHVTWEEVSWRVRAAARTQRERILARVAPPRWDRDELANVLAADVLNPVLRTHLRKRNWHAAHRALARTLRARPRLFVLDPSSAPDLRDEVLRQWPDAAARASSRADCVLGGEYDLLGYHALSFAGADGRIDWHFDPVHQQRASRVFWADVPYLDASFGDHKIIWELNRHQHWFVLGRALWLTRDRRYGWAIVSQLEDWIETNPPLAGINWASMLELSLRSIAWVWALHLLLADTDEGAAGPSQPPWIVDLLLALDRQLTHVEHNLSYYFSPNTHLTGEGLALYVAGLSVPELASSSRWARTGRRILLHEIDRQVAADGGHVERSTHYHRYTLDFYLLALLMAERADDADAVSGFTDAVTRAAEFARTMADDSGRLPLIGDDDGGMLWPIAGRACNDVRDSLALAACVLGRPELAPWGVPEEAFWIGGRWAFEQQPFVEAYGLDAPPPPSRAFTDTGYVVARDGEGGHLVFDVGEHGYLNGGHAHADALSVTLSVHGHPLLVDPGTGTYTVDPEVRDRLRSSYSHNTLTLDGRSPSIPAGPFQWQSRADAHLHAARHNPAFDWAEASHNGYAAAAHRRTILRAATCPMRTAGTGGWLIVDEILGHSRHEADLYWHFDPAWAVTRESQHCLRASRDGGAAVWLLHEGTATWLRYGDEESGLGWHAPVYGILAPLWTARVSRWEVAPFELVTWIAPAIPGTERPPTLARVDCECDPGGAGIAMRVVDGDATWTTLLRPGEPAGRETRDASAGAYHTDARVLQYCTLGSDLVSLGACDVAHLLALRDGWLSVAADTPISDLYVEVTRSAIELWSSAPAPRLRLQGALIATAPAVRLNGREFVKEAADRGDSLVVSSSQWGDAVRTRPCVVSPVSRI